MSEAIRSLVDEVILALAPLVDATGDQQQMANLLAELGWTPVSVPQPLLDLSVAGASLVGTIGAEDGEVSAEQALAAVKQLIDAIDAIRSTPDAVFPGGIDVAAFKATIGRDLLDYLVVEYLLRNRHTVGALLRLGGIIRLIEAPAAGLRQPFFRRQIQWNAIGTLLTNPIAGFQEGFAWNSTTPALTSALGTLGSLLEQFGGQFTYFVPDGDLLAFLVAGATASVDFNMGIDLRVDENRDGPAGAAGLRLVVRAPTAARGPAISLMPYAELSVAQEVPLTDQVSVSLHGDANFAQGIALTLAAGRPLELETGFLGGTSSLPADVEIRFAVAAPPSTPTPVLIGSPSGSHLSVQALRIGAGAKRATTGVLDAFATLDLDNAHVVIKPDPNEADSFLASILGDEGISADVSLGAELSSLRGFHLSGSGGLSATYPVGAHLGPVDVRSMSFGLKPNAQGVDVDVGASIHGSIGPVAIDVDGLGFTLEMRFPDPPVGNLGPVDVAFGFKPPTGVGLSVDAHGVLTGGGFLQYDAAQGMYAGVLQLSLHDELTLTAYGLIATRMPDGSRGYSLLIFITADGFQPIPLGLGFMLQSIGGMVGINRTFDQAVLTAGLKTDTLSTLLFPRDPVANAPALLQALTHAFPAKRGSYLLGLLARITWFTPTLVTMDLALILELGARTRLLLLGRMSALLPSRDNDLIRLNLDALGVLDFDAGTLAADAVLVDSRLVHQFSITGAAAVRAHWGDATAAAGTHFILAVGGLHPRFAAPAGFPTLERVAIALCAGKNPRLVCEAYFAITANTVQFGARASLYAEAVGFSVSGDLGFDALVTLVPPHFLVDFHASMQLKRGSHNLFKITLKGTLEGPLPLRLAAKATFEILWYDFTVAFDYTLVGGTAAQTAVAAVALEAELKAALGTAANWSTRRAPTLAHGVALRPVPAAVGPVLDPLGELVVQQQLVPLNLHRDVTTYGGAPVAGRRRFALTGTLTATGGTPVAGTPVKGVFAPARYFVLSDDDKLAAPSFEAMDAGLVLGDATVRYAAGAIVPAPLAYAPITLNPPAAPSAPADATARYPLPVAALTRQVPSGAAAQAPVRQVGRARFRNPAATGAARVAAPQWKLVHVSDGTVAPVDPGLTTWSEYRETLATLNRGGAQWQMVPTYELEVA